MERKVVITGMGIWSCLGKHSKMYAIRYIPEKRHYLQPGTQRCRIPFRIMCRCRAS